jgi:hypothetical protein
MVSSRSVCRAAVQMLPWAGQADVARARTFVMIGRIQFLCLQRRRCGVVHTDIATGSGRNRCFSPRRAQSEPGRRPPSLDKGPSR